MGRRNYSDRSIRERIMQLKRKNDGFRNEKKHRWTDCSKLAVHKPQLGD